MNIQLTYTGEQKVYHAHHKPFVLQSDIDLPKMHNAGWNSFAFDGGEPDFVLTNDLPLTIKFEVAERIYFESVGIEIARSNGTTVSGYFQRTLVKADGRKIDVFNFS